MPLLQNILQQAIPDSSCLHAAVLKDYHLSAQDKAQCTKTVDGLFEIIRKLPKEMQNQTFNCLLEKKDRGDETALYLAASKRQRKTVQLLFQCKAEACNNDLKELKKYKEAELTCLRSHLKHSRYGRER
ncbi:MAG: hypothetical protein ACD_45C00560G0001, partial [uncultured bacterium]